MRTEQQILNDAKEARALGLEPPPLTAAERARAYGDQRTENYAHHQGLEEWTHRFTLDRIASGLPVAKDAAKAARRWQAEQKRKGL